MKLTSQSLTAGERIADEFVFAVWSGDSSTKVNLSSNKNPHLAWQDYPAETKSFAVLCVDPDVPSVGDDVNQDGKSVSANLPRVDFFHWTMIDLPVSMTSIDAGQYSNEVTARGKSGPQVGDDLRHGKNNYTEWFAGDDDMRGDYYGYDGPCPPWNDELIHRYRFVVHALNCEKLPVEGEFADHDVVAMIEEHSLAKAELTCYYSINPKAKEKNG